MKMDWEPSPVSPVPYVAKINPVRLHDFQKISSKSYWKAFILNAHKVILNAVHLKSYKSLSIDMNEKMKHHSVPLNFDRSKF
jgi:hypothetical protein